MNPYFPVSSFAVLQFPYRIPALQNRREGTVELYEFVCRYFKIRRLNN